MRLTWFVTLLILTSCSSTPDPETFTRKVSGPEIADIPASYEAVWRATLQTMGKYPLKTYDEDTGVIETDYIRGQNIWMPPYKKEYGAGGFRYKINVKLIKVKSQRGPNIRVVVLKLPEIQKDFFSSPTKVSSDGLEELSIVYRIEREIQIQKLLKRHQRKGS